MKHKHAEIIKQWADGAQIQYEDCGWRDCNNPAWDVGTEYRVKPPEPKWPETTMSGSSLDRIWCQEASDSSELACIAVANAAIAHACETGQLVTKDAYEKIVHSCDKAQRALLRAGFVDNGAEEWKPPVNPKAAELTAAIAGIESRDEQISILRDTTTRQDSMIQELRADRDERDMKIAQAVKYAVIDAWSVEDDDREYSAMRAVNLELIIKEATK